MTRFRIVVAVAALVALGSFVLSVGALAVRGGALRSFGWTDAPRGDVRIVDAVDPHGPAAGRLQVGDRLLSVDGDTLTARYGTTFFRRTQRIGTRYTVTVERDGHVAEHVLSVEEGRHRLGRGLAYLLIATVWCAVGLFIGFARPDDAVARLAFGAAVSTGIVYFQAGVLPGTTPGAVYQPLHMVLGYHFVYRFPRGVRRGRLARALLWVFYAWGAAVCASREAPTWMFLTQGAGAAAAFAAHHPALVWLGRVGGVALMAPLVVATAALLASAYRRLGDPVDRRRIRWVVLATASTMVPMLLWTGFAFTVRLAMPGLSPIPARTWHAADLALNGTTMAIPIAVAYAVLKHRIFDIAVVVRRGLQYLLARRALQVLLALPALAVVASIVAHRDRTIGQLASENLVWLWLIGGLGLSLRFRQPILLWLDRRFFREQYDREQVLVGLLAELGRLASPSEVARLVVAQVKQALHPSTARVWFEGDPDPPPEPLLARIERWGPADAPLTSGDTLPDGVSVAVPLVSSEERVQGVLLLGEKLSEEPYSSGDLSLLGIVAKETTVMHENLLLRERIGEERRVRTDVLARLEPDHAGLVKECPACGACYDAEVQRCARDGRELTLPLPVGRVIAGRYRLDVRIGRGGMGTVYEARDLHLGRPVAIKFALGAPLQEEHALRRFRREARALASIHHPNVVSVHDYGTLEGHGAYLVMERIRGVTLREELQRRGALEGREAVDWFAPLLDGVAAAHEEGVIHRDLKPEHVVRMRPEHAAAVVKILDFGVAKVRPTDTASDNLTATGTVIGTLGYMSPEQLGGADVDARSDLFAVGVMLVEALTGVRPFRGASYGEILTSILLEEYHLPAAAAPVADLDTVVQGCLAKDRNDRYVSADELRRTLLPVLAACPRLAASGPQ